MRLLEVFKDFKVTLRGKGQFGRYDQLFTVEPKTEPKHLTLEDLQNYVKNLQERYPNHQFYLRRTTHKGKTYYVITRKSYRKLPNGKKKRVRDRIPIYIDLENQKFYIPQTYVKRKPRLTNYIIFRTLGALGISTVKYEKTLNRATG